MSPAPPEPVDLHVGAQIRYHRQSRGMSQHALARALGVSVPMVQKYETAANRVSASRLYAIAGALALEPGDFFAGLPAPSRPDARLVRQATQSAEAVATALAVVPELRRLPQVPEIIRRALATIIVATAAPEREDAPDVTSPSDDPA